MSAHHFAAIAKNTDRIATCLEEFLKDSREARNIDVEQVMRDAMEALRNTNPVFALAFDAMQKQLEEGEKS
jgi:hypothetical protein